LDSLTAQDLLNISKLFSYLVYCMLFSGPYEIWHWWMGRIY